MLQAHCVPNNDERMHALACDCWCAPRVDQVNPDTGKPWASGGVRVVHHALDGREACEFITGETLAPDKNWRMEVFDS